jgi:hypothetical protein
MPQDFSPQITRLYKLYVFYKNNRILVSVHNLEIEIGRWSYADNTMAKRKRATGQTMIYKTQHRKQKIDQHEPALSSEFCDIVANIIFLRCISFDILF